MAEPPGKSEVRLDFPGAPAVQIVERYRRYRGRLGAP
jgi:hypothetical protein